MKHPETISTETPSRVHKVSTFFFTLNRHFIIRLRIPPLPEKFVCPNSTKLTYQT
jgi:hypothetical protein